MTTSLSNRAVVTVYIPLAPFKGGVGLEFDIDAAAEVVEARAGFGEDGKPVG